MTVWRLGSELRDLMGDMPQGELADRVGIGRTSLNQIMAGRVRWPKADVFNALARELDVPVTRLLRAAGANIPTDQSERIDWLVSQLDDSGLELLFQLGHAILPQHRRRQETGAA